MARGNRGKAPAAPAVFEPPGIPRYRSDGRYTDEFKRYVLDLASGDITLDALATRVRVDRKTIIRQASSERPATTATSTATG
jgi:hypothetical protein